MGEFRPSLPGERRGGRQKGTLNKSTAALKDMILAALDRAGGVDYLLKQARKNPGPFMALVGKVLPTTLAGDPNAPLVLSVEQRIAQEREAVAAVFAEAEAEMPATKH